MKYKCEYCGNFVLDTEPTCPSCGAVNNHLIRSADGVPKTIEELKAFAEEKKLPLEEMRFFIGMDYRGARAFGIYKNAEGNFVVYKNKDDGSRAVRYQGLDEAYAVNEIYQKLKLEIMKQREFQESKKMRTTTTTRDGSTTTTTTSYTSSHTTYGATPAKSSKSKKKTWLIILIISLVLLLICCCCGSGGSGSSININPFGGSYDSGYSSSYDYDSGYSSGGSIFDWGSSSDSGSSSSWWDSDDDDSWSSDWDSGSDWDFGGSWDSGSSDWGSDW